MELFLTASHLAPAATSVVMNTTRMEIHTPRETLSPRVPCRNFTKVRPLERRTLHPSAPLLLEANARPSCDVPLVGSACIFPVSVLISPDLAPLRVCDRDVARATRDGDPGRQDKNVEAQRGKPLPYLRTKHQLTLLSDLPGVWRARSCDTGEGDTTSRGSNNSCCLTRTSIYQAPGNTHPQSPDDGRV